jgi:hypothetical protein
MRLYRIAVVAVVATVGSLLLSPSIVAHHGSSISYDMQNIWTTKATVTEFHYANPHPWLAFFNRTLRVLASGWRLRRFSEFSLGLS